MKLESDKSGESPPIGLADSNENTEQSPTFEYKEVYGVVVDKYVKNDHLRSHNGLVHVFMYSRTCNQ